MDLPAFKRHLPTFVSIWETRRRAARNRLPRHLRPPAVWPVYFQIVLNTAILLTLLTLMMNRDEYLSEAGPAMTMIVCVLLLIYTIITGVRMKKRYRNIRGQRWATLNFWIMALAFLAWPACIAVFLP